MDELRWKIAIVVILSLIIAFPSFAKEKGKQCEFLFFAGGSYATSRFGPSLGVSFSYHLTDHFVFSSDLGAAYHIPQLDFPKLIEFEKKSYLIVNSQYRLLFSFRGEYSFDVSPRFEPFLTVGAGWSKDRVDFEVSIYSISSKFDESITCSEDGECRYQKSAFPLFILGGGVRCYLGSKVFCKVMIWAVDPGGYFSTYQIMAGWGVRF